MDNKVICREPVICSVRLATDIKLLESITNFGILDLGGSSDPEKIVYSTYDSCTKKHDYCGSMGCALDVFDDKGEYALSYIAKDDWFIRPASIVSQKPTYELVMPLSNGKFRIVKVINGKLAEIESNKK